MISSTPPAPPAPEPSWPSAIRRRAAATHGCACRIARKGIAEAADTWYGRPSDALPVAGVTGTNGKTTTGFLLQHLIAAARGRCGLIGTVQYDTGAGPRPATHTTPDWIALQQLLAEMRDGGCAGAAMEVSSHALQQSRVHRVRFDTAIFTNLTQDHLDYHGSMEAYFMAKAAFFDHLTTQGGNKKPVMVVNSDDPWGRKLLRQYEGKVPAVKFGLSQQADFRASDIRVSMQGTQFKMAARGRTFLVHIPLIGRFNVFNTMAALAAAWSLGLNLREAVAGMARAPQVPGRMQNVAEGKSFRVFVDYAHTPDALENALKTLRDLQPRRLISVFGCGGDRDRTKRPKMGAVSEALSDWTILTSDNPRSEDPESILADIRTGMRGTSAESITERRTAIEKAIGLAGSGDIVLIAGKGHEQGQIIAGAAVLPFDDVKEAQRALRDRSLPERV